LICDRFYCGGDEKNCEEKPLREIESENERGKEGSPIKGEMYKVAGRQGCEKGCGLAELLSVHFARVARSGVSCSLNDHTQTKVIKYICVATTVPRFFLYTPFFSSLNETAKKSLRANRASSLFASTSVEGTNDNLKKISRGTFVAPLPTMHRGTT
jgi:hypothetical protein